MLRAAAAAAAAATLCVENLGGLVRQLVFDAFCWRAGLQEPAKSLTRLVRKAKPPPQTTTKTRLPIRLFTSAGVDVQMGEGGSAKVELL